MGLVKRTYVDGETVITADNLNDIQDEIIQNASDISTKGTYSKPSGGIPSTDMTTAVQTSLGKADTAYQKPSGGIPSTELASGVQTSLGKADTAYQKPSGGIPSTDLASAVQTSLGKADTALQSSDIDNTLTVSGKAADAKKTGDEISGLKNTLSSEIATRQTYVRPNLLDNWYFVYGRAINNDYSSNGTFPINQRGQQSYTSAQGYGIDRWFNHGQNTMTVHENGIECGFIRQKIEKYYQYYGKTATLSMLRSDGTLMQQTGTIASSGSSLEIDDGSIKLYLYADPSTSLSACIENATVKAVKLELGSGQTLAHNEGTDANPVWVLNEIPDYTEQFLRCCGSKADSSDTYANQELVPDDYLIRGAGVADLNSITTFSTNVFFETTANTPVPNTQGVCVTFPGYQNTNFIAIQLALSGGNFYRRYAFGAGFSAWVQI